MLRVGSEHSCGCCADDDVPMLRDPRCAMMEVRSPCVDLLMAGGFELTRVIQWLITDYPGGVQGEDGGRAHPLQRAMRCAGLDLSALCMLLAVSVAFLSPLLALPVTPLVLVYVLSRASEAALWCHD